MPIAYILGFMGYCHQVMPVLQVLSHATRAYIHNARGLPGFIQKFEITKFLQSANKMGLLEEAKKWQEININQVTDQLKI